MRDNDSVKQQKLNAAQDLKAALYAIARSFRGIGAQVEQTFLSLATAVEPTFAREGCRILELVGPGDPRCRRGYLPTILRHEAIRAIRDYWTFIRTDEPGTLRRQIDALTGYALRVHALQFLGSEADGFTLFDPLAQAEAEAEGLHPEDQSETPLVPPVPGRHGKYELPPDDLL